MLQVGPSRPDERYQFSNIDYPEDDADSDYVDQADGVPDSDGDESDHEDVGSSVGDDDEGGDDSAVLYSDITPSEAPILLAHLQSRHMTRVQYVPPTPAIARRQGKEANDEMNRNCVICMAEPRVIICWPCRCLSLCDECRGSLAARSAASKHHCPCCRQP